jgi:hypothetical protein
VRPLNALLVALALAGFLYGGFQLGRAVEQESGSVGDVQTTTTSVRPTADEAADRRELMVLVGQLVLGGLGVIAGLYAIAAMRRKRRRKRWRVQ